MNYLKEEAMELMPTCASCYSCFNSKDCKNYLHMHSILIITQSL
jgi:hypothetical protein